MTVHDFTNSLELSHKHADSPWWKEVYRQAFPTMVEMVNVRNDGWAQRGGIDRQVILADGTVIKIDEKVRAKTYDDFCLEYWSNGERQTRGWAVKELTCDFIAYAFAPARTCYLLPFQLLRRCCVDHEHEWAAQYQKIPARNHTYTTWSIAVPIPVVLDAIKDAMVIHWAERAA
jgi:hypothetical protein